MKLAKDDLIAALRLRYDYYSAQTMLESALTHAGLPIQDAYDAAEIAAFRTALARVGDRLGTVDARLDALAGSPAPAPTKAEPKAAEPKAEPKAAEAKPATKATDAKAADTKQTEPKATEAKPTDAKPAAVAATIETTITLTGVPVEKGDRVLVCGGLPELGDWDVANAKAMVREGNTWLATLEIPAGTEAAFKFVRCAADGKAIWEAGDNRSLVAVPSIDTKWQ